MVEKDGLSVNYYIPTPEETAACGETHQGPIVRIEQANNREIWRRVMATLNGHPIQFMGHFGLIEGFKDQNVNTVDGSTPKEIESVIFGIVSERQNYIKYRSREAVSF